MTAVGLRTSSRQWLTPSVLRLPPGHRTLTHLLASRAARTPDRLWLVFDEDRTATFGDVSWTAERGAARLCAEFGERPQVGLMMRSGLELVELLHATLRAGGVAYLLDPAWPDDVALDALRGVPLDLVLADEPRAGLAGVALGPSGWRDWLSRDPIRCPGPLPHPSDDAIVVFTSGTTATPKGVVCSHHYAFCYSAFVTDSMARDHRSVLATPLPLTHSGGLHMAVHSALQAGCVAHVATRFSAGRFWTTMSRTRATQANLVAEMVPMIADRSVPAPHRLEYLLAGGFDDTAGFGRRFGTTVLHQAYGMSEVYLSPMTRRPWSTGRDVLGLPLGCFRYGVAGESGAVLGVGEVGELVVAPDAGNVLFERYLRDRQATDAAWRDGVFHTGDLAEVDESGILHFRGRVAGRIRRLGENIAAREIEAAAEAYAGVRRAAAYAVPVPGRPDDIKIDVEGDPALSLPDLHRHLRLVLRKAAVPRYLERLDALLLTPTMRPAYPQLRDRGVDRAGVVDMARE